MPGAAGPNGPMPGGPAPGAGFTPAPSTHLPNPTLAGLLGIIPGVGAMYNGQLVKGLMHLAVFGVLVVFQNNISGIFGIFVAGWILYQIFDAYHTARARRDGTAPPNLFGINDLADRIASGQGFGAPPVAGPYNPTAAPPPPAGSGWEPQSTGGPAAPPPPPVAPAYTAHSAPPANWAGYAHPSTFAVPSPPPPPVNYAAYPTQEAIAEQVKAQAYQDAGLGGESYPGTFSPAGTPLAGAVPAPTATPRRFPVGALWLIAFGVLVLVGNLSSEWKISGLWVLAGLFAALAVWTLSRRLEWAGGYSAVMDGHFPRLAGMLRAPIMLLTLSVLFFLQAAHIATFGQTWPILPIAFGIALFLERTVGATTAASLPSAGSYYAPQPAAVPVSGVDPSASTDTRDGQR
ncbi:hypothetical protein [Bryocella elongata]|nr:hypothetical protein [Bryocella elongata]